MYRRFLLAAALAAGLGYGQGRGIGDMGGGDMGGAGGGMGGGRGSGAGRMGGDTGGGMPRATQRQTKLDQFYDKLKLNKDQKEEAARVLSETAGKARPLVEQYNKARQQVAMAFLAQKSDEEMKPLMEAYVALCAQMTAFETEAFGRIYTGLKASQQKNAPQAFELLAGMFVPNPGMGRGMGRGGRN